MKTKLLSVSLLWLTPLCAMAGKEGGGADIYETRFHFALDRAHVAIRSSKSINDEVLRGNWLGKIEAVRSKPIKRSERERLFDEGQEKAALALPLEKPDHIVLSVPFFETHGVTPDEAFVLAVHETGHLVGIPDHQFLDQLGRDLLAQQSKQALQEAAQAQRPQEHLYELFLNKNLSTRPNPAEIAGSWEGRCWARGNLLPDRYYFRLRKPSKAPDAGPLFSDPEVYQGWQLEATQYCDPDNWQSSCHTNTWQYINVRLMTIDRDVGVHHYHRNHARFDPKLEALIVPFSLHYYPTLIGVRQFGDYLLTGVTEFRTVTKSFEVLPPGEQDSKFCYYFERLPEPTNE
ncbi:MAG: hypothetical protein COT74_02955 [Bdellovibrionales bacterium CG10_big_fil_rev_8_21_14_0_10_45_34]|nr:MAG: hypothetical protein COT74_02955 [Bdellovibrionales bacterium CG10_big_fil_rev_8_21_14_0_10_45_34]